VNINQSRQVYLNYYSRKPFQLKPVTSCEIHKDQKILEVDSTAQNFIGHLHTSNLERGKQEQNTIVLQCREYEYEKSISSSRTSIRKAIMTSDT